MRSILLAAAASLALAMPALAKTFELPEANPAVVVTLPDAWKPDTNDTGVSATSDDGDTFVSVDTATAAGMDKVIGDDIKFLADQGVTVDAATQEKHDGNVNGMPVTFLRWSGKDKDGPTMITLGIFGVTDNLVALLTAWSSPEGEKKHDAELGDIMQSFKRR